MEWIDLDLDLLNFSQREHFKVKKHCLQKAWPSNISDLSADSSLTIKEKSLIFSARARILDVKANFKVGKTNLRRKCLKEEETQKHLLECPELMDNSVMTGSN